MKFQNFGTMIMITRGIDGHYSFNPTNPQSLNIGINQPIDLPDLDYDEILYFDRTLFLITMRFHTLIELVEMIF